MSTPVNIPELLDAMLGGDVRALSRLMTIAETQPERVGEILGPVFADRRRARRIGIAGPPGAGKSTLVSALVAEMPGPKARVGVLCIDPTSPLSGGALLGDRIRMSDLFDLDRVFIRSVASGDSLGGLAEATRVHAHLLEAFGVDAIFIETVGIGQVGYDIRGIAETLLLVLVPESGDTIQVLKSGIIELADILVVNKADRDGAAEIADSLRSVFADPAAERDIPVALTTDRDPQTVRDLWKHIDAHRQYIAALGNGVDPLAELTSILAANIKRRLRGESLKSNPAFRDIVEAVLAGRTDPYTASLRIVDAMIGKEQP